MEILYLNIIILIAIVEIVLRAKWSKFYFRKGIPILRYEISHVNEKLETFTSKDIEVSVMNLMSPVRVRQLSPKEYAIREVLSRKNYFLLSIMHGNLQYKVSGKVRLVGLIDWYPICFLIACIVFPIVIGTPFMIIPILFFFGIIFIFIYFIQLMRYKAVLNIVASLGSDTKQIPDNLH